MDIEGKLKNLEELFTRGVGEFIDPSSVFKEKLTKKIKGEYPQDIIVKFGIDPTRPDIHLGHAVVFRRLRQLQDLGCKIVFLVGDFTAQIGDPTGKSKVRPEMEQQQVEENVKTYLDQVGKILLTDKKVFSWVRNSDWFTNITDLNLPNDYKVNIQIVQNGNKLEIPIAPNSFVGKAAAFEKTRMQIKDLGLQSEVVVVTLRNILWTLKHITHAQLVKRDMFQERIKNGIDLYMHEMLYPIFQGIDSFALNNIYGSCDLEVGGTDQTFNMLMGRQVQETSKNSLMTKGKNTDPQAVLSMRLLEGTDGKEKMSKSLDNYIGITDSPEDMYGKIMSVSDASMQNYFELCTYTPQEKVHAIMDGIKEGKENPRDAKMHLARQIVAIYHGEKDAEHAEHAFVGKFQKKEVPENIPEITIKKDEDLGGVLVEAGIVASRSEFKRLLEGGAVVDVSKGVKLSATPKIFVQEELVLRIGKKNTYIRVVPE